MTWLRLVSFVLLVWASQAVLHSLRTHTRKHEVAASMVLKAAATTFDYVPSSIANTYYSVALTGADCTAAPPAGCPGTASTRCFQTSLAQAMTVCDRNLACRGISLDPCGAYEARGGSFLTQAAPVTTPLALITWRKAALPGAECVANYGTAVPGGLKCCGQEKTSPIVVEGEEGITCGPAAPNCNGFVHGVAMGTCTVKRFCFVGDNNLVAGVYDSAEVARKAMAAKYQGGTNSRMVVEFINGVAVADPHMVDYLPQGNGEAAGWNKFWWDWWDINRMVAIAAANTACTAVYTVPTGFPSTGLKLGCPAGTSAKPAPSNMVCTTVPATIDSNNPNRATDCALWGDGDASTPPCSTAPAKLIKKAAPLPPTQSPGDPNCKLTDLRATGAIKAGSSVQLSWKWTPSATCARAVNLQWYTTFDLRDIALNFAGANSFIWTIPADLADKAINFRVETYIPTAAARTTAETGYLPLVK